MNYANFSFQDRGISSIEMNSILPAPDTAQLFAEIEMLSVDNFILKAYPYQLIVCNLIDRPALRQEIGRQREITFRQVGESTGQPLDTDTFDDYYDQLIIWDENAARLVGGYRFGCGDKIFREYGRKGFYIHTLFEIDPSFDVYLPECIELGRSFIIKDYQKRNLPLYLLWKGIFIYQLMHPRFKYLIGPVSISRFYSDFSRIILMEYSKRHLYHPVFSKWFRPRIPFDPAYIVEEGSESDSAEAIPDLENLLDHIRPEHIRYPVLMRQYIRQNARFLGFNLDPAFNDALDGLMILDMADVPSQTIELLKREL